MQQTVTKIASTMHKCVIQTSHPFKFTNQNRGLIFCFFTFKCTLTFLKQEGWRVVTWLLNIYRTNQLFLLLFQIKKQNQTRMGFSSSQPNPSAQKTVKRDVDGLSGFGVGCRELILLSCWSEYFRVHLKIQRHCMCIGMLNLGINTLKSCFKNQSWLSKATVSWFPCNKYQALRCKSCIVLGDQFSNN